MFIILQCDQCIYSKTVRILSIKFDRNSSFWVCFFLLGGGIKHYITSEGGRTFFNIFFRMNTQKLLLKKLYDPKGLNAPGVYSRGSGGRGGGGV